LCCAGVTAYNAIKQCNLAAGEAVAIIGVGGVGQMGVQYAKAMGLRVIAVDKNDYQLKTAEQLGADDTINPVACPDYPLKIKTLTNQGVDAALNFTADAKVYDDMPSMLRYGGILMVVGVVKDLLRFDCMDLISQRYVVKAACNGLAKDLDECIRFSVKHNIKPVVEFRDLEDIPAAIAMMEEGKLRHRVCVNFAV
jgi:D-arabinose 1-dehydrogenase-like Zn-dependent alcohol dehydrogenase